MDKGSPVDHRTRPKLVKLGASLRPNWNIWDIIRLPEPVYALRYVCIRDVTHTVPSAGLYCELIWR